MRHKVLGLAVLFSTLLSLLASPLASAAPKTKLDSPPEVKLSPGKALNQINSVLKNKGVTKLPSTSTLVRENHSSNYKLRGRPQHLHSNAVTGTPPTLVSIATLSPKDIFWRSGVVDAIATGAPDQTQCNEFYDGNADGESGGFGACVMAQEVGHVFQRLLKAESALCNLKSFPTKGLFRSGGASITKGHAPSNDVTELFSPGNRSRLIKIHVPENPLTGDDLNLYTLVASRTQNKNEKYFYRAETYYCGPTDTMASAYATVYVTTQGKMDLSAANVGDANGAGSYLAQVTGFVEPGGSSLVWNEDKGRSTSIDVIESDGEYKALVEISSDNIITTRERSAVVINDQTDYEEGYSLSHYSGSNVDTLRFLEGGYKGNNYVGDSTFSYFGAAEYRDTYYAAAPTNQLFSQVQSHDLDQDTFYTEAPTLQVVDSGFACDSEADIEIEVDPDNNTVKDILSSCRHKEFDNIEFCNNDSTITQAEQNYTPACFPPAP